ncbi:hypothetical protein K1719_033044 [Acacia pycnantha]|nr:hypothetical protein K1719_033044 [Acacia pycnantha]
MFLDRCSSLVSNLWRSFVGLAMYGDPLNQSSSKKRRVTIGDEPEFEADVTPFVMDCMEHDFSLNCYVTLWYLCSMTRELVIKFLLTSRGKLCRCPSTFDLITGIFAVGMVIILHPSLWHLHKIDLSRLPKMLERDFKKGELG